MLYCNKWKVLPDRDSNPGSLMTVHSTLSLSYLAYGHLTNNFSLLTYPGYTLPKAVEILSWISCGEIHKFTILFHEEHTNLTTSPQWVIYVGAKCNRWQVVAGPRLDPRASCRPCEQSTTKLSRHQIISPTSYSITIDKTK